MFFGTRLGLFVNCPSILLRWVLKGERSEQKSQVTRQRTILEDKPKKKEKLKCKQSLVLADFPISL